MAVKIFIDQGHNPTGFNTGAEGNGLKEQDITYNVGMILAQLLRQDDRFEVLTSRTCISQIVGYSNRTSLEERVWRANWWGADWFISIHCNSSTNPNASGSEIYVYRGQTRAYFMAENILEQITTQLNLRNRGVRINPEFYVLRKTQMPAVLVEMGFISNAGDAALMNNSPELFAEGIYNGILQYTGLL